MNKVAYLLSTKAIREQALRLYDLTLQGGGQFELHLEKLDSTADMVIDTIKEKYPQWQIPYHSRWGHFQVGGKDRIKPLLTIADKTERARALFDLVIVSVLLDAGSGHAWHYRDQDGDDYTRSEGLAVASLEMFRQGIFSSDPKHPWRADKTALEQLTTAHMAAGLQVTANNPLAGLQGRAALMVQLGKTIPYDRPGYLFDELAGKSQGGKIHATQILAAILHTFGAIWPGRITLEGVNLGDCWQHDALGVGTDALVPFHKLSQWLTYSLLEPLEMAGIEVVKLDELTALAEYRNGGLLIDAGLITPKNPAALEEPWQPDAKLVIEWRALTIVLIDRLAERIRQKMHYSPETLPLAKILEGGTWWTGRKLANAKRHGKPPIEIMSDGTVF